jgi:fluoride ion exporter CrcB/FEX
MELVLIVAVIAILGGLGSVLRYILSNWSGLIPSGILLGNSLAAVMVATFMDAGGLGGAIAIGLAGGLSTFSTVVAQTSDFIDSGKKSLAVSNIALNLVIPALLFLTVSAIL